MTEIVYGFQEGWGYKVACSGAVYEHVSLTDDDPARFGGARLQDPNHAQK